MDGCDYLREKDCDDDLETHLRMGNRMNNAGFGLWWKWIKTMILWIIVMDLIMDMDCGFCIWIGHRYWTLYGYELTLLVQE